MTISIIGILFLGILGAITTAELSSGLHRDESTGQTALRDFAEYMHQQSYQACPASYSGSGFTPPTGYTATITLTEYWVPPAGTPGTVTGTYQSTCGASDSGLERLSLRVSSPDSRAGAETVQILKRAA